MYIIESSLIESIVLTASCDGNAYSDGKDVDKAIRRAVSRHMKEIQEKMLEAAAAAKVQLRADWYEDEIKDVLAERNERMERVHRGETVEIPEADFEYYMNIVPPIRSGYGWFYVGEAYAHTATLVPVHMKCWREDDKYYAKLVEVR
jgi:hypothetical protein